MRWVTIATATALVMLAVLGHGAWHHPVDQVLNFIVNLLTGANVTG